MEGSHANHALEMPVKIGEVVKTAVITNPGNTHFVVNQEFAGITDANFQQELPVSFHGAGFEIPAKRIMADIYRSGDLANADFLLEIIECVIINIVDTVGVGMVVRL